MKCPDCRCKWGEMDLALSACQGCGDPILPDDLDDLRNNLGISGPAPPEVEQPVIESAPEEVPDAVDCPDCFTPMMGDDLAQWNAVGCPYCGHENPSPQAPAKPDPEVADQSEVTDAPTPDIESVETAGPTLPMIVNVGPMVGQVIMVPAGVVGRGVLSNLLPDPWYEQHLARVSGEHLELTDGYGITDLGSTNGTYVGGNRISDIDPIQLGWGVDLNLGGNIQLCRAEVGVTAFVRSISHEQSGVMIHITESELPFHLGRLTEGGDRERWAAMADLQLRAMGKDESILGYISRRHFTIVNGHWDPPEVQVFEGTAVPEILKANTNEHKIKVSNNSFILHNH